MTTGIPAGVDEVRRTLRLKLQLKACKMLKRLALMMPLCHFDSNIMSFFAFK